MWLWGRGEVSFSGSSLRPMMTEERGAVGQELCSARVHPTLCRRYEVSLGGERERCKFRNARLELGVVKDALGVALDGDGEATSVDELLGGGRGESRAVLELLGLATQPELIKTRDKSGRCR